MAVLVSIGVVAELFGVTPQTIRNWEKEGIFKVERTIGGHRRFSLEEVEKVKGIKEEEEEKKTIIYSRVSSYDQKEDLKRQTEEIKEYCRKNEIKKVEVVEDIGSGINYQKRGLRKLIAEIILGKVKRIILTYKDRLLRFGSEILYQICRLKNIEIVTLHQRESRKFEQELVEDVLSILTVYSAKIYGRRSHKKRKESFGYAS